MAGQPRGGRGSRQTSREAPPQKHKSRRPPQLLRRCVVVPAAAPITRRELHSAQPRTLPTSIRHAQPRPCNPSRHPSPRWPNPFPSLNLGPSLLRGVARPSWQMLPAAPRIENADMATPAALVHVDAASPAREAANPAARRTIPALPIAQYQQTWYQYFCTILCSHLHPAIFHPAIQTSLASSQILHHIARHSANSVSSCRFY